MEKQLDIYVEMMKNIEVGIGGFFLFFYRIFWSKHCVSAGIFF